MKEKMCKLICKLTFNMLCVGWCDTGYCTKKYKIKNKKPVKKYYI